MSAPDENSPPVENRFRTAKAHRRHNCGHGPSVSTMPLLAALLPRKRRAAREDTGPVNEADSEQQGRLDIRSVLVWGRIQWIWWKLHYFSIAPILALISALVVR